MSGITAPDSGIAVSKDDAGVMISLSYRYALRELLAAIHKMGNSMGRIKAEYGFTKNELYRELDAVSFKRYIRDFILASVSIRAGHKCSEKMLIKGADLRSMEKFLRGPDASNIRIITSVDDFIMEPADVKWLASTFGRRVVFFEHGGHLGELYRKEAENTITGIFKELQNN
jgi:hypothetical protein